MPIVGYNISTADYFGRGVRNLNIFRKQGLADHLIYAALEFRNAIERLFFEHLYLLKLNDWNSKWEKLYRPKDLRGTLLTIDPEFEARLHFMGVFLEALQMPRPAKPIDLAYWNELYGRLGNYSHAAKKPEATSESQEWWDGLIGLLEQVETELGIVLSHPFGVFDMNAKGVALFEEWRDGSIRDDQVRERVIQDISDHSG